MDTIRKFETVIAGWFKDAPHLPVDVRRWLATNAWWLVIIGVVLSVLGLLGMLSVLGAIFVGLSLGGVALGGVLGGVTGAAIGSIVFVTLLVSLALFIVETILLGMAVRPLKVLAKKGWTLLFIILLLNVAVNVITNVLSANLTALVWSLLWSAVGAYFLFEVRGYFGVVGGKVVNKPAANPEVPVDPAVKA